MKRGRSADVNGFTAEILKLLEDTQMVQVLVRLFNRISTEGRLPEPWGHSVAVPIHKKGSRSDVGNYRMIMINNIFHKLMSKAWELRLRDMGLQEGNTLQAAFRPGRSCTDHLFTLRMIIEARKLQGRPIHTCFIDFQKAFDSIPRDSLWKTLDDMVCPPGWCVHCRCCTSQPWYKSR